MAGHWLNFTRGSMKPRLNNLKFVRAHRRCVGKVLRNDVAIKKKKRKVKHLLVKTSNPESLPADSSSGEALFKKRGFTMAKLFPGISPVPLQC